MLALDYRFDDALMLLAKHPPEAARDNHLNQLLGFAVSQFCGLPQHAQRYPARLGQYRGPVAQSPQLQRLIQRVVGDPGPAGTARAAPEPESQSGSGR